MCRTQRNTPRGSQILSLRQRALAQDDSKLHYYSAAQPALTFKKPASKFAAPFVLLFPIVGSRILVIADEEGSG